MAVHDVECEQAGNYLSLKDESIIALKSQTLAWLLSTILIAVILMPVSPVKR